MSVKEQIVCLLQQAGYDTITACEQADATIAEFIASGDGERTYNIGKHATHAITLKRG